MEVRSTLCLVDFQNIGTVMQNRSQSTVARFFTIVLRYA